MKKIVFFVVLASFSQFLLAQTPKPTYTSSPFEQLGELLPTPNTYRNGAGYPGHQYWQQKADYNIQVTLDDDKQRIKGSETITYYNNSPDNLDYLWVQLDQNRFLKDSETYSSLSVDFDDVYGYYAFMNWFRGVNSTGGYQITKVTDEKGNALNYVINKTMMRIDLPQAVKANGGQVVFNIDWEHNIVDADKMGARGGYEYFPEDDNYLYEIAQWFPRMAVYDDVDGWQNKQFLGRGEFALTFGDYTVAITVPEDHIVASTGVLQNAKEVLSSEQQKRLEQAANASAPVLIVTQEEAEKAEKSKASKTKTWIFKAENVRDFAWASSRKFIWDAMKVNVEGNDVWAMSYYPKEGNPLWGQYSTNVVAHTLKTYSKYTFAYPYPVAISVHGPVFGMEYPMICFNGGRPNPDGTVPERTRYAMISVIIHEVGHNYFPMIVNSDERQWTWMDEGLNSFLQYLSEVELKSQPWASELPAVYPSRRGPARNIVDYMRTEPSVLVPIMTNSEQIDVFQFGNNAYGKPATALNILRETVMGKELFDYAFKQYAQRWQFKHPQPADFFRTMEDASGVDLDWFWRGWFYETNPVEISLEKVTLVKIDGQAPSNNSFEFKNLTASEANEYFERFEMAKDEQDQIKNPNWNYYVLNFKNNGGLVMPLIIQANYADGTSELLRIPAEIWRINYKEVNKVIMTDKQATSFILDPYLETADIDIENNGLPREEAKNRFEQYKKSQ